MSPRDKLAELTKFTGRTELMDKVQFLEGQEKFWETRAKQSAVVKSKRCAAVKLSRRDDFLYDTATPHLLYSPIFLANLDFLFPLL